MSKIKAAEVRFYIDADLLGLARVLGSLRPDVTYPGDPGAVIHKRHDAEGSTRLTAVIRWAPQPADEPWPAPCGAGHEP